MFKFNLGDKVKCTITGFDGVITARTEFMNRCIRYGVQSQKLKDGKPLASQHFDEEDLELVKSKKAPKKEKRPGGPKPAISKYRS